jgi:hypothetical protein
MSHTPAEHQRRPPLRTRSQRLEPPALRAVARPTCASIGSCHPTLATLGNIDEATPPASANPDEGVVPTAGMRSRTAVRRWGAVAIAIEKSIAKRFRWSNVDFVGLAGLEPAASSLSGIEGSPLCGAAFSQVAADRQGRSNAFLQPRPTGARTHCHAAGKIGDQPRRRQGDGTADSFWTDGSQPCRQPEGRRAVIDPPMARAERKVPQPGGTSTRASTW